MTDTSKITHNGMPLPPAKPYMIFCTCPNDATAKTLAQKLIQEKLAACVNILPGLTSLYTWQNKLEITQETLMIIKTTSDVYSKLEAMLLQNHPYECPEVLGLPIDIGQEGYLKWLKNSVSIES